MQLKVRRIQYSVVLYFVWLVTIPELDRQSGPYIFSVPEYVYLIGAFEGWYKLENVGTVNTVNIYSPTCII
jgi:hypothetical protein